MPESTLLAFQNHGAAALTLEQDGEESRRLLERLAEVGLDYDDVVRTLEIGGDREVRRLVQEAARRTGSQDDIGPIEGASAAMTSTIDPFRVAVPIRVRKTLSKRVCERS